MGLSRRMFVRTIGAGGVGAFLLAARGREALADLAQPVPEPGILPASIRLDSNENPNGPGPVALDAVRAAFAGTSRYPDRPEEILQETVARSLGVPAASVVAGCGSTEILRMAVQRFSSPDRPLVTAAPTFEAADHFARRLGYPVITVPLDPALKLDLGAMESKCSGAGLLYVCNPNNPTGTAHGAAAIRSLAEAVGKASPDTTILIDEAYFEYVEDPACATAIPLAMENPRVIVSRTFSKVYGMAGLRIGYAVGAAPTLEALALHKLPSGVNLLGAAAAVASIGDPGHVASERRLNREAKAYTRRFFESAGYRVVPSETNFIMVDIRRSAREFRDACRGRKVMVGRPFPPLDTHTRISIGTMDEMRRAVEVFREVLA